MKVKDTFNIRIANALKIDHVSDEDKAQYQLCAELWCLLCLDCGSYSACLQLATAIEMYGLYSCIESADKYAKAYLQEEDPALVEAVGGPLFHMWKEIMHEVALTGSTRLAESNESAKFADPISVSYATCQVVLRFPKRFTRHDPDISSSIRKFKEVQNETARYSTNCSGTRSSSWPGLTIRMHLARVMREILTPYFPDEQVKWRVAKRAINDYVPEFSSGVCFFPELSKFEPKSYTGTGEDGKQVTITYDEYVTLAQPYTSKVKVLKYGSLCLTTPITERPTEKVPNPWLDVDIPWLVTPAVWKRSLMSKDVLLKAVPKDYETSRIIAPNTPYLNYVGDWIRYVLLRATRCTGALYHMNPTDQSVNREKAREGSCHGVDNPYVTLDLSHASDSISRNLFFDVCPPEYHPIIKMGLEARYWLGEERSITKTVTETIQVKDPKTGKPTIGKDGKPVTKAVKKNKTKKVMAFKDYAPAMLATTGNKLTPMLQSIFFLAIGYVACDLCNEPRDVYTYNDDIICRQAVAQTYIELLQLCGLTVNDKKSFTKGYFRESCGGEYCAGIDVTGMYWPRRALTLAKGKDMDPVDLQGLIEFQHKMFNYPNVRMKIEQTVLGMFPKMSYSPVGSDCSDLWTVISDTRTSMCQSHYYLSTVKLPYTPKDNKLREYCNVGKCFMIARRYDGFFNSWRYEWNIENPSTMQNVAVLSTDSGQCTYSQEWRKAEPLIQSK